MDTTTISQSRNLVRLGLDPLTADMHYSCERWSDYQPSGYIMKFGVPLFDNDVPMWSLSALLRPWADVDGTAVFLAISPEDEKWKAIYQSREFNKDRIAKADTPLEAAYALTCWLLENGVLPAKK